VEIDHKGCVALVLTGLLLLFLWCILTVWVATQFSVLRIVAALLATMAIVAAVTMALWFLFRVLYHCVRWVVDQF
jgi:hypothetical protein